MVSTAGGSQLAALVAYSYREVRRRASDALPQLGNARLLAVSILGTFDDHPEPDVRALAARDGAGSAGSGRIRSEAMGSEA